MDERPDRFRRQQRRRAIIAWGTVGIVIALIVLGALFGGEEGNGHREHPNHFGYSMTAAQYAGLRRGLDEQEFVDRLEQTGLPENLTAARYVELFPPHSEAVVCSFWEISDRTEVVARICFSDSAGRLVQKLERGASGAGFGVSA
jgi:hypothetical protein